MRSDDFSSAVVLIFVTHFRHFLQHIKLWEAETCALVRSFRSVPGKDVYCVCISEDGTRVVSGGSGYDMQLWDAATGSCLHTLKGELRAFVEGVGVGIGISLLYLPCPMRLTMLPELLTTKVIRRVFGPLLLCHQPTSFCLLRTT